MRNKILMTLALLITAATGAWADDYLYLEVDGTSATVKYGADKGTKPYYGEHPMDPDSYGWYVATDESMPDQVTKYSDKNTLTTVTIDASCQNYTGTTLESLFDFWSGLTTINNLENLNTSEVTNMKRMFTGCSSMTSFDLSGLNTAKVTKMRQMFTSVSVETLDLSGFNTSSVTDMYCMFYNCSNLKNIYVGDGWSTASVTDGTLMFGKCTNLPGFDSGKVTHEMAKLTTDGGYLTYKAPAPAGPEVTLNEDKTEAEFEMPGYDVTLEYEIVRDLSHKTAANIIVGEGQEAETLEADSRLRIQKTDNGYVFVDPLAISFSDELENVTIAKDGFETAKLVPQFYIQQDDAQNPWTLVPDDNLDDGTGLPNNLQPGQVYCVTFVPGEGSAYDGETPQSVTITLFEGYPVEIAAGEFATFYSADPVYAENEGVQFYTITSVSGDKAMLSEPFDTAPSNTPVFVYNSTEETQSVLLIPTNEPNLALDYYEGFVGTAEATTIAASDEISDQYAFNGKQFVWVMNELPVAANKCWLEMPKSSNAKARTITIVFGETTGVRSVDNGQLTIDNEGWYDLNGRKLQNVPTKKGVYIMNGKKVVVK